MLWQLFQLRAAAPRAHACASPRRCLPRLEILEDRTVPATLTWDGPAGGSWATGANWADFTAIPPTFGTAPGAGDTAIFGGSGADTSCVVGADATVWIVNMDTSYTSALSVATGVALTASESFTQNGTLALAGTATSPLFTANGDLALAGGSAISTGDFYVNGAVSAAPSGGGTSSHLTASSGLYLSGGTVTVTGGTATAPGLVMTCENIDDAVDIDVGDPATGASGSLGIVGKLTQQPAELTEMLAGSWLGFTPGTTGDNFDLKGMLAMSGATLVTGGAVKIDGGTLNSLAPSAGGTTVVDTITGDLSQASGGTLNVGFASGGSTTGTWLVMSGSLLASDNVNVVTGCTLDLGAAAAGSAFTVSGTLTLNGASTIINAGESGGVAVPVDVESGGTLQTNSDTAAGTDFITGSLTNDGIVEWAGPLHTLMVGGVGAGNYSQGSGGEVDMRMQAPALGMVPNDSLAVGGSVALDGTLNLTALNTLPIRTQWFIIFTGPGFPFSGDFAVKNLPGG